MIKSKPSPSHKLHFVSGYQKTLRKNENIQFPGIQPWIKSKIDSAFLQVPTRISELPKKVSKSLRNACPIPRLCTFPAP